MFALTAPPLRIRPLAHRPDLGGVYPMIKQGRCRVPLLKLNRLDLLDLPADTRRHDLFSHEESVPLKCPAVQSPRDT